jgi:hypothetical protein
VARWFASQAGCSVVPSVHLVGSDSQRLVRWALDLRQCRGGLHYSGNRHLLRVVRRMVTASLRSSRKGVKRNDWGCLMYSA